jgi:site-specific recombinase XerD
MESDSKTMERLIEKYLLWRIDSGYSQENVKTHHTMLNRYMAFIQRKFSDKDAHSKQHFDLFLSEFKQTRTRDAINGFKKYLISEKMIEQDAGKRNDDILPEIYEQYMTYYRRTRDVGDSRVRLFRRVLSVFNAFLQESNIGLENLSINIIDRFFNQYHNGLSPSTRRNDRTVIRLFLQYLHDQDS